MSEPYVGQITLYGFNFAPRNFSFCNGALVPISQNQALFSIIGTTYGGNGIQTFGLPNTQDSSIVGQGQSPGTSNYVLGQTVGADSVTLQTQQMPMHSHIANGSTANAPANYVLTVAQGFWLGQHDTGAGLQFTPAGDGSTFAASTITTAGGSQPHMNEQPYLGMNYCIALYGIFPSRN